MDESRITLEALVDAAPDDEIAFALAQLEAALGSGKPLAPKQKNSADGSPNRESSVWRDLLFLLVKMASIALAFVLMFTFLFGIMRYREPSMAPAIRDGDLVIFYRYTKSGYQPQDAIILRFHGKKQARRVVATAGDIVDIAEDGLVVNGALQQELGIYQETQRYQDGVDFPLTVPEGQVFVLGDSRTDAADSRIYGCVKIRDTLGKVITVLRRRGI
ncbi:MAG: signal peptidase I [Firmicutes bacterium]|nr:signal peptidase I [Bacillota bacterium]